MNKKQIHIRIEIDESIVDKRLLPLESSRLSFEEYRQLNNTLPGGIRNPLAEKIVNFIFDYSNGALRPDKWDIREPLREVVTEDSRQEIIHRLSSPDSSPILKKKKTNTFIFLYNNEHGPTARTQSFIPFMQTTYCVISIVFQGGYCPFMSKILYDACSLFDADNGYICDDTTGEVIEFYGRNKHYLNSSGQAKDILPLYLMSKWLSAYLKSHLRFWARGLSFFPQGTDNRGTEQSLLRTYSLFKETLSFNKIQQPFYFVLNMYTTSTVPKDVFSDWSIFLMCFLVLYRKPLDALQYQPFWEKPLDYFTFTLLPEQTLFLEENVYLVESSDTNDKTVGKYIMITKENMIELQSASKNAREK